MSAFLDAVNVSAVAVMLVVAIKLGGEVLIDWTSLVIALPSVLALIWIKKLNTAYLILGGAVLGYIFYLIGSL
jgi:chromate transporter